MARSVQEGGQAGSGAAAGVHTAEAVVIKAKRIYTGAGEVIEGGMLLIRDRRVEAVGKDVPVPPNAKVIEFPDWVVTPGLIDANAAVDSEIVEAGERARRARQPRVSLWEKLAEEQLRRRDEAVGATELSGAPAGDVNAAPPEAEEEPSASDPLATYASGTVNAAASQCPHSDLHKFCEGICPCCGAVVDEPLSVAGRPGRSWAEHSSEVTPHLRVIDTVNLLSNDFERLLKSGVTTVWVAPDSASVIGSRGAIVKTGGPLASRVVRAADSVKAALGTDSFRRGFGNARPVLYLVSFLTRRPTTRMGVAWVFRKAFYDALRAEKGLPMTGADAPPKEAVPALLQILHGELPLRIQARMEHDILTAIRLAREFGLGQEARRHEGTKARTEATEEGHGARAALDRSFPFILEEATEAYKCLPELKAAGVPVIFGPIFDQPQGWRANSGEARDPRLNTARQLYDAGIPFVLTANDLRDEDGLVRQAMLAVRYGLPPDEALRAITSRPAELLGLAGKVGTLSPGAAADLVVWNTEPLDATSRAVMVMIDGSVAYRE